MATTSSNTKASSVTEARPPRTNYILVDYEHLQLKELALLKEMRIKLVVFIGSRHETLSTEIVLTLQSLGCGVEYVPYSETAEESLAFHIAFTAGMLCQSDPQGYFHIISEDTGFEPLIKYLRKKRLLVLRSDDIAGLPLLRRKTQSTQERMQMVIESLNKHPGGKPRTQKALRNVVRTVFGNTLDDSEVEAVLAGLRMGRCIHFRGEEVIYNLPSIA